MADEKPNLILIIDDDADFREIIRVKLKAAGFQVEEAEDGEKGIQKATELNPNLILLDLNMPGMDGIQTLAKMKANPNLENMRVIFLTSYGTADAEHAWLDKKYAKEFGAVDHIRKTDDLDSIVKEVKAFIVQPSPLTM